MKIGETVESRSQVRIAVEETVLGTSTDIFVSSTDADSCIDSRKLNSHFYFGLIASVSFPVCLALFIWFVRKNWIYLKPPRTTTQNGVPQTAWLLLTNTANDDTVLTPVTIAAPPNAPHAAGAGGNAAAAAQLGGAHAAESRSERRGRLSSWRKYTASSRTSVEIDMGVANEV